MSIKRITLQTLTLHLKDIIPIENHLHIDSDKTRFLKVS